MTIYFLVVLGFYFLFLLSLLVGLRISSSERHASSENNEFISVIVAMRNEKTNIGNLLRTLSQQSYPINNFEVIVVDDQSEDGSKQEAEAWLDRLPVLKILSLGEEKKGKKAALGLGIERARGEVIATTDADCLVPTEWLANINRSFHLEEINMCIGAVALQNEDKFFSKLQSVEFVSVMATGISLAKLTKPTMCNGANLSFRKKAFEEVGGYSGNEHIASGDDEFLMRKISAKYSNSIHTMTDSVVVTKPQASLADFVHQRLRWASKWKHNSSAFARLLAIFVFIFQLSWLTLIPLTVLSPSSFFVILLASKVLLELIVLSYTSRSLGMKFSLPAFAVLQLLYPVYVLYIGLFSQIENHQWKGRTI